MPERPAAGPPTGATMGEKLRPLLRWALPGLVVVLADNCSSLAKVMAMLPCLSVA